MAKEKQKMTSKTSWRDKVNKPLEPQIKEAPESMARWGTGKMLIATPLLVEEVVKNIPEGTVVCGKDIRNELAKDFDAEFTCPLTTGIFLRLVSEAAEEDRANGRTDIAPYWRVVKDDGSLNSKFPGGEEHQAALLAKEGIKALKIGKKWFAQPIYDDVVARKKLFKKLVL